MWWRKDLERNRLVEEARAGNGNVWKDGTEKSRADCGRRRRKASCVLTVAVRGVRTRVEGVSFG
jgi:hypothetical protein